jgi:LPXTG-motif cell wall-anchored protein
MKSILTVVVVVTGLVVSAADVYAMAWGGGRGRGHSNGTSASYSGGPSASVPEPSTLYAAASGLSLLAGAGWYLRRRK